MKRITALLALALVFALTCPALISAQTTGSGATATPDHVHLTWTGNPSTTMTLNWRTDTETKTGLVEYAKGAQLSTRTRRIGATSTDFVTDLGPAHLFAANLSGLSPNTEYSYRVGDGNGHWSTTHTFTTAPAATDKVKFLIFGDSQSSVTSAAPYGDWATTVHNAYKANPDAKFMINVGDLVDVGQNCAHWNAWFDAAAGVIDSIPEMPVIGNHETTPVKPSRRPSYWIAQFALPQNGPDAWKSQAYSFDYGPVHIAVLDSQQAEEKAFGDLFGPEKAWLEADLAASKATWKLVFFHKAVYEQHPTRKSPDVKAAFCPTVEAQHADMVFNGHDHGVARSYPIRDGVVKQRPSEGTVYCVVGRSGSKFYKELVKKPWNAFFYNPTDQPNYQVIEIDGTKLTMRAVKQDGTPITSFYIDKSKDLDSDCLPK